MGQSAGAGMIPPAITYHQQQHRPGKIIGVVCASLLFSIKSRSSCIPLWEGESIFNPTENASMAMESITTRSSHSTTFSTIQKTYVCSQLVTSSA